MEGTFDKLTNILPNYPQVHVEELKLALNDLDAMIGLTNIKQAVFGQLAYALMLLDNDKINKNRYMLHTLITGPPGVGKSNLAHILGRIWSAIGIVGNRMLERKDFNQEQETIFHMSRDIDLVANKLEVIYKLLPQEVIEKIDAELDGKSIG